MTESTDRNIGEGAAPDSRVPVAGQPNASRWEDFIDIFYAPSSVFARRATSGFLLPMEARGLYREMLTQAWMRGARLPNDPASSTWATSAAVSPCSSSSSIQPVAIAALANCSSRTSRCER